MSLEVNVTKRFDGFTLHAAFTAGDTATALLGASGCGKSMTLRCIAGIVRPDDACNAAQGHAFAAAGRAQKGGGSVPRRERSVEGKAIKPLGHIYFQAHARFPPCFCLRSSRFTASSTTAEITISTSTHCMAPASSLVRQSW